MDSNSIVQTISGVLDALSQKLGVAVDKIYPVLMAQTKVDLIQKIFSILIGLALIFISTKLIKFASKRNKKKQYDWEVDEIQLFSYIGAVVFIIAGVIMTLMSISDCIQIILNPNYYIFDTYIRPLINK